MRISSILNQAEARLRAITADRLGVAEGDLHPTLSLVDELAIDSLDLAELAASVEEELAITLPDTALDAVRTYADLVGVVLAAVEARRAREADTGLPPVRIVARISRAAVPGPPLERSGELTPYFAQTLVEDAQRLGVGSRLEVTIITPSPATIGSVRQRLAPLGARGIEIRVEHAPLRTRLRDTSAA